MICMIYDLAHVAGRKPCNLLNLAHVSWLESVRYRSCTASRNGRLGSHWSRSWSVSWSVSWSIWSIWSRSWSVRCEPMFFFPLKSNPRFWLQSSCNRSRIVCLRCAKFCWVEKHRTITMKPTNSPTQGQPNPKKKRVEGGTWATFSHS